MVRAGASVREAMRRVDASGIQMIAVVDADGRLVGIATDGDIRRGLLAGVSLDDPIESCINPDPLTANVAATDEQLRVRMRALSIDRIPVVDSAGRLVAIRFLDQLLVPTIQPNPVVLMVGGLGSRLGELTRECPKPMLPVGGKPLLEIILETLIMQGFREFHFAVNYRGEMIESHFRDGKAWGCSIRYLREEAPLGTAGALSLLSVRPQHPLIVSNGDLLHQVDLRRMLDHHRNAGATATMAVREYQYQIPYGVVHTENGRICGISEKPIHSVQIAGGLYVLEPETLLRIPGGTAIDMPDLFERLIREGAATTTFPIDGYWIDIGQVADYERAVADAPSLIRRLREMG
ncbi:nucleotidyltransferase family protein [Thermaurantiacus sp.]